MIRERRYDVVVIGAGMAGMVAGIRLAQAGASVCVVAKGYGSTHLAPGTIDVLGYTDAQEPVEAPGEAITALAQSRPDHPYALLGQPLVGEALDWFLEFAALGPLPGYAYHGDLSRNFRLPTAVGALKPTAIVPDTFASGDATQLGRVVIVGVPALRDFHPRLCAANLRADGIDARGVSIDVEVERADTSTLGLARRFDDAAWLGEFSSRLAPLVGSSEHVGLPAMLGVRDPHAVLAHLEDRLGRRVFEIPTLPPSVPGLRVFEILRTAFRAAGGHLMLGAGIVSHTRAGDRVASVDADTAGSKTTYAADAFVLATGGFHSGAITLDSHWRTAEGIFDLPLHGVPAGDDPRFLPSYFDEQPIARAGVAVDGELRAQGAANVVVAGALLPGAVPWREASGEGLAIASGYRAAQVLAGERAGNGAQQAASDDDNVHHPETPAVKEGQT